ncbi:MAG: hypothetical protein KatS3mg024_2643 [Armatimonadota bacterium]|nr:MAG: hypothetical protein KatS3mg024_2643 [Armatimonadota bacterium]
MVAVLCCAAILAASAVPAANDRPLIFGMNPTPMEWWGYDRMVWDPILFYRMADCASSAPIFSRTSSGSVSGTRRRWACAPGTDRTPSATASAIR